MEKSFPDCPCLLAQKDLRTELAIEVIGKTLKPDRKERYTDIRGLKSKVKKQTVTDSPVVNGTSMNSTGLSWMLEGPDPGSCYGLWTLFLLNHQNASLCMKNELLAVVKDLK
ncbi:hypothetical protein STEG23_019487, partial [Scotinomys teguina]